VEVKEAELEGREGDKVEVEVEVHSEISVFCT
jgi:hypothetical protein